MTIRQIFYTSCRSGLDGIQGFQVNAATPGIGPAQREAALGLSGYRPGPGSPSTPSAAQLAGFPVAVGYRSFGDYAVLFHSRYLGQDFTGRYGNYFAHILVLDDPERDLAGALPVQAWRGPGWCWEVADGVELPALREVPGGGFDDWSVGAHLRGDRLPEFAGLLSAVQAGLVRPGSRVVLVAPSDADAATAIAAVTRSLPEHLARSVSFTTFTAAPDDVDVLLVGTTPDVSIPSSPFGNQRVVRLGEGRAPREVSRYARVVEACWQRADDEVGELLALARTVEPPLGAAELDDFAHLVELVVPDPAAATPDLLAALEFAVRRAPGVLTPTTWRRVEQLAADGPPMTDIVRWSRVLAAARARRTPVPSALEHRYLAAVLSAVAFDGLPPDEVRLPGRLNGADERFALEWADRALRGSPTPTTAIAVLGTLERTAVQVPEAVLRHVADAIVVPALLDRATDAEGARVLERMPLADRLVPVVAEGLDHALREQRRLDVAAVLPVGAARLLGRHASPGSWLALLVDVVDALAGRGREPVAVLRAALRLPGGAPPGTVDVLVSLLWPEEPLSVTEAVSLGADLMRGALSATSVPLRAVDRIEADAAAGGLAQAHADLADALSDPRLDPVLGARRDTVQAVRLATYFRASPRPSPEVDDALDHAMTNIDGASAAVRRWTYDAVAAWIADLDARGQAAALSVLFTGGPEPLGAYRQQLIRVLNGRRASATAAALPALAALAAGSHRQARTLLDDTCAMVLSGRSRRDLEAVAKALGKSQRANAPLLREMGRKAPKNWLAWWEAWQSEHLRRSLLGRLMAKHRTSRAAD